MQVSPTSHMVFNSYPSKAKILVKDYLLADAYVPYTSVFGGILMSNMASNLTLLLSSSYFKGYNTLTKSERTEWNNRGMSSAHAIFITVMSLYLVFFSNLYSDFGYDEPIVFRSTPLSTFALGISVGYFIIDLTKMFWVYPALGGIEYVFHHLLSLVSVAYSMFSSEGQLYTYMVLISEATTPIVNLRWYLDTAGLKRSNAYLINGIMLFLAWLVARILLFGYLFHHLYRHYEQIKQMHLFGCFLVYVVPSALSIMNMIWFTKIVKGARKTLASNRRIMV